MAEHTLQDLKIKQALPLAIKVNMTKARIKAWVDHFGLDGVYVSFSGGKDSTVLLHIAREIYPDIKAVFVDTGLEYPEIREFVKGFDNVDWIKPKLTFKQVIEKYGYPFISKEVAECVQGARKYLTELDKSGKLVKTDRQTDRQIKYAYRYDKLCGTGKYKKFYATPSTDNEALARGSRGGTITNTVNLEELESLLKRKMANRESVAIATPAAVEDYTHINTVAIITIPCGCCMTVSGRYVDGTEDDPAVTPTPSVLIRRNASISVERIA